MTLRRRRRALLISQLYFLLGLGRDKKKTSQTASLTVNWARPNSHSQVLWSSKKKRVIELVPREDGSHCCGTTFERCYDCWLSLQRRLSSFAERGDGMMFVHTKLFSTNMDATAFVLHATDTLRHRRRETRTHTNYHMRHLR